MQELWISLLRIVIFLHCNSFFQDGNTLSFLSFWQLKIQNVQGWLTPNYSHHLISVVSCLCLLRTISPRLKQPLIFHFLLPWSKFCSIKYFLSLLRIKQLFVEVKFMSPWLNFPDPQSFGLSQVLQCINLPSWKVQLSLDQHKRQNLSN